MTSCGIMDEMNFAQGSDVDYTKSKIMKTYRSVKRRMQSRFTKNGVLQAKLFLVSSKKSDQDFIESYVETVRDEPTTYIVDEPQWNVKPPGTFSNKRFKVAVGDKKIHSKIVLEGDNLEDLEKQGYRIIDVPLELKKDFERDVDSSLMEFAGISSSIVTKFISYDSLKASYCNTENPFGTNIISIGTNDSLQIQDFFKPDMIPEIYRSKPLYIHIDGSLTGDRTGISGVWVIGLRETQEYTAEGDFTPVQELIYKHAFSIGIQCPAGAEISLEKNRKFIYYLKYSLGYNIKVVSLDGFQSADSKQQLLQAGFDANITSVDRTSDPYMYFKASINERRIAMINNIPELEEEIINLERNNMTGKIDHPNAGKEGSKDISDSLCLKYDTKLFLLSGKEITIEELYNSDYSDEWILACDIDNKCIKPIKINKVIKKNFIPSKLYKISLDNGKSFEVTEDHLILCRDSSYKKAKDLNIGESLMPFNVFNEFSNKNYYRRVVNPYTNSKNWIYKLVTMSLKKDEYDNVDMSDGSPYKVIHHINHDKTNDNPSNLKPMSLREHRKLHSDIITEYNKSEKHRDTVSKLCEERKLGFGYVYDKNGPELFKENGTKQITKYNKSEKHRKEASERGKITIKAISKLSQTPEAKRKRINTKRDNGCLKKYSETMSNMNRDPEIKHKQNISRITKVYNIVKSNSNLFEQNNVTYEEFINEIRRLKSEGIINKYYSIKYDYDLMIEAGVPITNHKIINIEIVENYKPVYDLQLLDIHNFGIDAGVFVHNCGALWNASKFEDISSLHVLEDFNTISETNALIVNTEENVMKNLTTSILSNETSEEPSLKDALKDAIQTLSKEQKENNLRLNRIKEARKNLSMEENARVKDEELESVIFNKDDNIIIW